jgi:hypothetical protein
MLSVTGISSVVDAGVSGGSVVSGAPQADVKSRNTSNGIKPWRVFIERSSLRFRYRALSGEFLALWSHDITHQEEKQVPLQFVRVIMRIDANQLHGTNLS